MAVHHLEDMSLSSKERTVTISIYFSTARKEYLLYWNGAYWTKKFSLLNAASEINQFMKRTELPEYPGMNECEVCANADNEYCFACDNGNQFKPYDKEAE